MVNFFNTLQDLYKLLMNGQTRYELFVKAQQIKKLPVLHLERLLETRWVYWYGSISKINLRYTEIIEVLIILSEKDDKKARALGILKEMNTLSFIKISYAMESLLRTIHCASKSLQDCTIILPVAIDLVKSTKRQLYDIRNDAFWNDISKKAKVIAIENGININEKTNNRKTCLNKNLLEYYMETTIGQGSKVELSKDLKIIFFSAVDR